MSGDPAVVVEQMKEYYRHRAPEYDQWFYRQGRYDHGADRTAQWWSEVAQVESFLNGLGPLGNVLELAAGTGIWTEKLAPTAKSILAIDSSSDVLELNHNKLCLHDGEFAWKVTYATEDLFRWTPPRQFDTVAFGFWLSHVPDQLFAQFWRLVDQALTSHGRVFLVDSLRAETSGAHDHVPPDDSGRSRRCLNDGSEYEIVKIFYEPVTLSRRLGEMGWKADIRTTENFFLFGEVGRNQDGLTASFK